jgi:hypothetical protein
VFPPQNQITVFLVFNSARTQLARVHSLFACACCL